MPRRGRKSYLSRGELNRLIDDLLHPVFKDRPELILIDAFLHGLVEQNPPLTVRKFLRYNLPQLMEQLLVDPSSDLTRVPYHVGRRPK